ncbi:DUF1990 family protein [Arthrobacter sp. MDT3-24]
MLRWKVKTASGFDVDSTSPVSAGDRVVVTARALGFTVVEPVEVVTVVQEPGRSGFSYRTLPGHPVDGEEAFIVHRRGECFTQSSWWHSESCGGDTCGLSDELANQSP